MTNSLDKRSASGQFTLLSLRLSTSLTYFRLKEMCESVDKLMATARREQKAAEDLLAANWLKSRVSRLKLSKVALAAHIQATEVRARTTGELTALGPLRRILRVMLDQRHPASPCPPKSAWPTHRLTEYLASRAFNEASMRTSVAGREAIRAFIRENPDSLPFFNPANPAPVEPPDSVKFRLDLYDKIVTGEALSPFEKARLKHFLSL